MGNGSATGDRNSNNNNIRNRDRGQTPTTEGTNTRAQNQGDLVNNRTTDNNNNADLSSAQPVPTSLQRDPEFERVASEGLSRPVEVYRDPDLVGNTVRAEYKRDGRGLVESVHLRAGPDATARDIKLHQHTVKVMRMYGGTLGRVRLVEAKIAKWMGVHGQPKIGSRAWEAQHEVPKLERVIQERMARLETAEPDEAQRLQSEVKDLQDQLKEHRRTFELQDESDGVGYVAAKGKMGEKITSENAKSLRKEVLESPAIQAKLTEPPVGVLTKQELGEWDWDKNNPGKERPKDLSRRGERLVEGWLEQGSEVYVTADGKVTFDKSVHEQYQPESKKRKRSEGAEKEEYVSPYRESMYGDSEKIDIANGWSFKTGEIVSTADRIAGETIGKTSSNPTDTVTVDPQKLGDAANKIDDFAYDRVADKPYEYGEGRKYKVGETEDGTDVGYKHYRQKFNELIDVGRIGDLESGRGIDYNRLPKELKQQLKAEGIDVDGKDGVYVGKQLTKLMNEEKLPNGKSSQTITELYGLWFAKEPSHPWDFSRETGKSNANYDHKRDLVYSKMITQLMASDRIQTLQEALDLHPASYGGAQAGARKVTEEMDGKRMPKDQTRVREKRDERYRREKETIQKWFEMHKEQFQNKGEKPTMENLEKFIKDNI